MSTSETLRSVEVSSLNHDLQCFTTNLNKVIVSNSRLAKGVFVLGIGGYTGVGKTTTAHSLAHLMGNASVLSTDSFMLDRNERKRRGILTGDSSDAINLAGLSTAIEQLCLEKEIEVPLYNHTTGTHDKLTRIKPAQFIVVEGTHVFFPEIEKLSKLKVFIDADIETQYTLLGATEVGGRGYSEEQFRFNWQKHILDSAQYITPFKKNADIICRVNKSRKFSSDVIENCQCA